jgi:hypothetical protein
MAVLMRAGITGPITEPRFAGASEWASARPPSVLLPLALLPLAELSITALNAVITQLRLATEHILRV